MQSPTPGALNIDHVAHFVPQREACHEALIRLGFSPTPFSLQQHRVAPDAPLAPVGMLTGAWLMKRVSQGAFMRICYGCVFFTGAKLTWDGIAPLIR